MAAKKLVNMIMSGGGAGANLALANLKDAKLPNAQLQGANLKDADLRGADLTGADLKGAKLEGADLRDAILTNANFSGADLTNANFSGADLTRANLKDADLKGARLYGADLRSADLYLAKLTGAKLTGAKLRGANLQGAKLDGEIFHEDLTGADLSHADLTGAIFTGGRWVEGVILSYANFTNADLPLLHFKKCKLSFANFTGANINKVYFTSCSLRSCKFISAKMQSVYIGGVSDLLDADFRSANMGNGIIGEKVKNIYTITKDRRTRLPDLKAVQSQYEPDQGGVRIQGFGESGGKVSKKMTAEILKAPSSVIWRKLNDAYNITRIMKSKTHQLSQSLQGRFNLIVEIINSKNIEDARAFFLNKPFLWTDFTEIDTKEDKESDMRRENFW